MKEVQQGNKELDLDLLYESEEALFEAEMRQNMMKLSETVWTSRVDNLSWLLIHYVSVKCNSRNCPVKTQRSDRSRCITLRCVTQIRFLSKTKTNMVSMWCQQKEGHLDERGTTGEQRIRPRPTI